MEQQSIEEVKPKITRSDARHLRRKRLSAARRIAEGSLPEKNSKKATEKHDVDAKQEGNNTEVLTKSKAKRLRRKKRAELLKSSDQTSGNSISDSENQDSVDSIDHKGIALESDAEFVKSFCDLPLNTVRSFNSGPPLVSGREERIFKHSFDAVPGCHSLEDGILLFSQKNSILGVVSDDLVPEVTKESPEQVNTSQSFESDKFSATFNFQIEEHSESKALFQSELSADGFHAGNESPFKAELYEIDTEPGTIERFLSGKSPFGEKDCQEKISFCELKSNIDLGSQSNKSDRSTEHSQRDVEKERKIDYLCKDRGERRKKSGSKSSERKGGKKETKPDGSKFQLDAATLDDSDDSELRSISIDVSENEVSSSENISDPISNTTVLTLNRTELIENQKNLKISGNPKPFSEILIQERISHISLDPEPILIDLTHDSSSDLIINNDTDSRKIEQQRFITDLISPSSSNLVQTTRAELNERDKYLIKNSKKRDSKSKENPELQNTDNVSLLSGSQDNTLLEASSSQIFEETRVSASTSSSSASKAPEVKMSPEEKTREQIKAEREAKKAAKAAAKSKGKAPKTTIKTAEPETKLAPIETTGKTNAPEPKLAPAKIIKPEKVQGNIKPDTVKEGNKENPNKVTEIKKVQIVEDRGNPSENKTEGKSKAQLRAERRAKQEAQRAVKEKQVSEKAITKSKDSLLKFEVPVKKTIKKVVVGENTHEVKLFKHLYHEREQSLINVPMLNSDVHPAIVRLGVQYATKVIVGSNARCVALLAAVKRLVEDFERPSQADFTRGLEASLQECSAYLHHCRPLAVSMQNALRHLKWKMTQFPATISDRDAKDKLREAIDTYISEQIKLAGEAISNKIQTKISKGDVILTYGFSSLINKILIDAHKAGTEFRVVIVDGRPWLEGKEQLRRLAKNGIECSYVLINALSFIMPEVSKVFLGAHAILANGAVMSRVGTAQVALMAKAFNVPVLVACETHKSCERVQTDSFVYNEIGDANMLTQTLLSKSRKSPLTNWRTKKSLNLLNITYDVTPADLVTAVVTELAILPCTSVPVILRIRPSEV